MYAQATGRSSQQAKKPSSDQKKNTDESDESANANTGAQSAVNSKEEDDIYEFKSTPKDSSSNGGDEKTESRKSEKQPPEEKSSEDANVNSSSGGSSGSGSTSSGQPKRPYSDVEGSEENTECSEDTKRKKRKDSENIKETGKQGSSGRAPQRPEKGSKQSGGSNKSLGGIASKVNTSLERKSPCASPKPATNKGNDSDAEGGDEAKSTESFGNGGPKVPPLKIVIPQQSTSGDMETGSRNGKSNSARSHAALPYVVASSSNSNDSLTVDKESASSRCASPAEPPGKTSSTSTPNTSDEKNTKASSSEDRAQQRVLRSSHRGGGQSVDRGSNNSSPQLQSNSPPPPPASANENSENTGAKSAGTNNSSPQAQAQNQAENETAGNEPSPSASSTSSSKETQQNTVELHPRKRKIRAKQEESSSKSASASSNQSGSDNNSSVSEIHPHDHPFTNCYQMFLNIRKQIEKKQRSLFPIQPRPPQGFKDYLMNRRTYVLAGKTPSEPVINIPTSLAPQMKELFVTQEKERHKLKMQHIVEKEKLGLSVEQEILRVHGKAARSLACQSLPFSVCTMLKDEEVYNMITPEQEEKDRNARSRYNGRLFLSWLQDVDDKWEKIKEAMVLRHHNEAESLHAVQKMDWEWVMKEHSLCEYKSQPVIDDSHVPIVHVSDDFDLLPA